MRMKIAAICALFWLSQSITIAQPTEQASIEWLCQSNPEQVKHLFDHLDTDREGLEQVKKAVEGKDWPGACRALLSYYQTGASGQWLRKTPVNPTGRMDQAAEEILKDTFTFQQVTGEVPRLENGRLDWTCGGPKNESEWGWFLNRHNHLSVLLDAYLKTGNTTYVRRISEHLCDWILSNPYPQVKSNTPQWRGLEAASRVENWSRVFYGLQDVDDFTAAARILLLSSLSDHAHYLRNFHRTDGTNWQQIELNGLSRALAVWPEFRNREKMARHAIDQMQRAAKADIYPDGAQKELTSHYHRGVLFSYESFVQNLTRGGMEVPSEFTRIFEKMNECLAYTMSPSGYGLLNNDSDRQYTRPGILAAAKVYDRPDLTYIATNGEKGKKPENLSVLFPWAGHVVMRNEWDANAHWMFFDIGPYGVNHHHADKLHLSIAAYGRDLLVDSGRYTYVGYAGGTNPWRDFFIGSSSHNVILIDGKSQKPTVLEFDKPLTNAFVTAPEYDFARGDYTDGYDGIDDVICHTRAVLYLRDQFWVVVDRVTSGKPHGIQALWRYNPKCTVVLENKSAVSTDPGEANLRIIPISSFEWDVQLIKGQETPLIQGWYSERYNEKVPNSVAVYTAQPEISHTFAWLMTVDPDKTPEMVSVRILDESEAGVHVEVKPAGGKGMNLFIPLTGAVQDIRIEE